jgi:hypothetical protein
MNIFVILIISLITTPLCGIQAPTLSMLSTKHGTDKGPSWHNYTPIYESYFQEIKDKSIKFLEIGFLSGASARVWDEYFQHSETKLHFIDIDRNCYHHMKKLSPRCSLHLVDQANKDALRDFTNLVGGDFDIIIDDGGHTMIQQITSFEALFPFLKKGGVYIIEDLHTSYWAKWGSAGSTENPKASNNSAIRFIQNLIDDLNYSGARTECADKAKCSSSLQETFNIYQKDIKSMHFYTSLCFIFKN